MGSYTVSDTYDIEKPYGLFLLFLAILNAIPREITTYILYSIPKETRAGPVLE